MKILYLFNGKKVTDKSLWSGTVSRLYNTLSKENDVIPISTLNLLDHIIKLSRKILKKIRVKNEFLFLHKLKGKIINKKISRYDYDYIFAPALSNVLAYLKTDKPIIYLTDATFNLMNGYYFTSSKYEMHVLNTLEEKAIINSTKIIVSSDWAKEDIVENYNCDSKKVEVIPFYTEFNIINNNIKVNKEEYNFLLVGVDWKRKGVDKAINAIKYLNDNLGIKSHLNIVGIEQPTDFSCSNCTFYGYLNKNNDKDLKIINELYNFADIFILPTVAECAGIVFAEASAYGLPIFTHDTGGIPNYVVNDYNGYRLPLSSTYIDFATKIKEMIDNNMLSEMSKNSHLLYDSTFIESVWLEKYNKFINNINER